MEEKTMREMIDYVGLLQDRALDEEAANQQGQQQAAPQQGQEQQFIQTLEMFAQMFLEDFMDYVKYKQRQQALRLKKQQQQKKQKGAPGFAPIAGAALYQLKNQEQTGTK